MADNVNIYKPSVWALVAGVLMVVAGIYAWFHPVAALAGLALYIGAMFIVAGVSYLAAYFSNNTSGWYLALGLLDVFLGIVLVSNLRQTMAMVPFLFGFWCLFSGILQISAALNLRKTAVNNIWVWPLISGVLGMVFAFLIMYNPLAGALAISILMGVYLFIYGVFTIIGYMTARKLSS